MSLILKKINVFIALKILLGLMFALVLLPTNVKPIVIILLGLNVLLINIQYGFSFKLKHFLINSTFYFLIIFSLSYSEDIAYGFTKLETMSSLLVFPTMFSLFSNKMIEYISKSINKYLLIYLISVVLFCITTFIFHGLHYKDTILIHYMTVIRIAQDGYNIHPIYLSIHIFVALIFSFFILFNSKDKLLKVSIVLLIAILIFFLLILLKKGPIIVTFLMLLTIALLYKRKKIITFIAIILTLFSLTIILSPSLSSKFKELLNIENIDSGTENSTNIRYSIYNIAIEKIKHSPFFGYGIGDYNNELIKEYKNKSEVLFEGRYNSHNQYLSFALSIGLVGLLVFITALVIHALQAVNCNNYILLLLIIGFALMMTFENILEREDGVIFFSFFLNFFSFFKSNGFRFIVNKI